MRRWRRPIVVVLLSCVAAAIVFMLTRHDDDDGDLSVTAGRSEPAGWQALRQPPVAPRQDPVLIAAGDALLFGGHHSGGHQPSGRFTPLNTGALFRASAGSWERVSPAPFDPPLFSPAAVWVDELAVVVGTPCGPHLADGVPECVPGGYAAAVYDPDHDRWERIPAPEIQVETPSLPPDPHGLLSVGTEAFFRFGPSTFSSYDMAADTWRSLPSPPFEADDACASGNRLVALASRYERDGQVIDERYPAAAPGAVSSVPPATSEAFVEARLASYDPGGHEWSPPSAPAPGLRSRFGFDLICGADGALVVARDVTSSVLAFDLELGRWQPVPSPPIVVHEAPLTSVALGSELFLWNGVNDEGLVFNFRARSWRTFPPGPAVSADAASAVQGSIMIYVAEPTERWGDRPRAFRFTPSQGVGERAFPVERDGGAGRGGP